MARPSICRFTSLSLVFCRRSWARWIPAPFTMSDSTASDQPDPSRCWDGARAGCLRLGRGCRGGRPKPSSCRGSLPRGRRPSQSSAATLTARRIKRDPQGSRTRPMAAARCEAAQSQSAPTSSDGTERRSRSSLTISAQFRLPRCTMASEGRLVRALVQCGRGTIDQGDNAVTAKIQGGLERERPQRIGGNDHHIHADLAPQLHKTGKQRQ